MNVADWHDWPDCRVAVVGIADDAVLAELFNAAAQRVFHTLPPADRRALHSFHCRGNTNDYNRAVVDRVTAAIRDQAVADQQRHAGNARQVLEFIERAGIEVLDPRPGEKIIVAVIRVRDSIALGDDPPPALAARRGITRCTRCGENCWLDPLSHGEAIPEPVCLRCLDPRLDHMISEAVAGDGRTP